MYKKYLIIFYNFLLYKIIKKLKKNLFFNYLAFCEENL